VPRWFAEKWTGRMGIQPEFHLLPVFELIIPSLARYAMDLKILFIAKVFDIFFISGIPDKEKFGASLFNTSKNRSNL
jgi:hypothetical protein